MIKVILLTIAIIIVAFEFFFCFLFIKKGHYVTAILYLFLAIYWLGIVFFNI